MRFVGIQGLSTASSHGALQVEQIVPASACGDHGGVCVCIVAPSENSGNTGSRLFSLRAGWE